MMRYMALSYVMQVTYIPENSGESAALPTKLAVVSHGTAEICMIVGNANCAFSSWLEKLASRSLVSVGSWQDQIVDAVNFSSSINRLFTLRHVRLGSSSLVR
jgi:hypothetical protein